MAPSGLLSFISNGGHLARDHHDHHHGIWHHFGLDWTEKFGQIFHLEMFFVTYMNIQSVSHLTDSSFQQKAETAKQ